MQSNWEFHFLDAPFIIADEDDASTSASSSKDESARWSQAAIDASLAVGLEAELSNAIDSYSASHHAPSPEL